MNREDFKVLFGDKKPMAFGKMVKARSEYFDVVKDYCKDFENKDKMTVSEMIWLYMNEESPGKCMFGNYTNFNSYDKGYRDICITKGCGCYKEIQGKIMKDKLAELGKSSFSDIEIANKARIEKYGDNFASHPDVIEKRRKTNQERYGSNSPFGNKEVSAKALEKRKNAKKKA